jgi:Bacterial SCP ortholog
VTTDAAGEGSEVRQVLRQLAARAPGRSVELRVPPHGATQLVAGPVHRRGTPKATVEMSPATLLALAAGATTWDEAVASGAVLASGERADLGSLFPLR